MSDEIKIITLGDIFKNIETEEKAFKFKDYITNLQTIEREYSNLLSENAELQQENDRLNNIINEIEKNIIEEIDDSQEELNIILQGNDLDYKNECTKEFNCIKNALDMLLDKIKELKENK